MSLAGNDQIVSLYLYLHAQTSEGVRNNAEVVHGDILYSYAVATHCSHTYERADLNHIGQNPVFCSMQLIHTYDSQQIRSNAAYAGAHFVQQVTELLQVGFAGSVVDGGSAFGKNGSHHDIGGTSHRGLVKQHVCSLEALSGNLVDIAPRHMVELCSKFLETQEMGVKTSAPNFVTTRLGNDSLTHPSQ